MRAIFSIVIICCAFMALPGVAASLDDLYQVREPVSSQQAGERDAVLRKAFDTLVLRLTGDADAASQEALAQLRENPQQLISKYSYEEDALLVDFDPATTERSLRQAGVSLWGANRPSILIWWLSDSINGSQLIGDGQEGAAMLYAAAQHRGLPLRLPLADLSEQLSITPQALQAEDATALREASERYDADGLLAVSVREDAGVWHADWRLWLGSDTTDGHLSGDSRAEVADALMLAVSQFLAPRYITAIGDAADITLEVLGADIDRFAELERLLEPLGGKLLRVESDRLVYRLNTNPAQLRAQLELARMQEVPAEEALPVDAQQPAVEPGEPIVEQPGIEQPVIEQSVIEQPVLEQPSQQPDTGLLMRYRW